MKLYKGALISIFIIVMSLMILDFASTLYEILVYNKKFEYENISFAAIIAILNFIVFLHSDKMHKLFINIFYVRKYNSKDSFGMKKNIIPKNIDNLVMSTAFYYSFCEYIEVEAGVDIIESNYLFFTIYEDEKLVLYYEPRTRIKKIMEVISNG